MVGEEVQWKAEGNEHIHNSERSGENDFSGVSVAAEKKRLQKEDLEYYNV